MQNLVDNPNQVPSTIETLPCAHAAGASGSPNAGAPVQPSGFVALSRFTVANGMTAEVKRAFVDRPHLVENAPGFVRLDVISPFDNPDEIWLITYWTDEESYRAWHRGHTYKGSHAGIPKGLRLDPSATGIRTFEFICS
jgi:heme oxygenase (mycobilin-producing)